MSLPFSSTNNLIIHASSSLFLTLLFTFIKIPSFFLHGLHTYIHPDDVTPPNPNSSGIKAAIRRPSDTTTSGIKPRKKTHEKFEFEFLDGYAKFCTAIFMGFLAGLLYVPAAKFARAYWLGTDQIRCNLSMIYCGWFGRILLYFSYLLTVFTSLLWINPFADLIVNKNIKNIKVKNVQYANRLTGNVGMSRSDFEFFRLCCLLATGVLNMISLRANLQMFLNEAVLSWYQRLHASKVPDLDYSRAKVFLHNHYLCLAGIQFFSPPALVLFFLGLSRINDNVLDHFPALCNLIPCSALVKEMSLFMGWWVVSVLGVLVSVNLALYRQGILYVS
ncbi:putative transmembrane protein 161A/B [Helianthus annuus]|nr:putative transmembrane protein 161A/B [Helianthus annuus]